VQIRYTSKLASEHLEELQELMFFNENQHQFLSGIVSSIEEFGEPIVKGDDGVLRIHTSRMGEVQALFAVEESADAARPVGVMVHVRNADDTITLLHIGVHKDFASDGPRSEEMVTLNLFQRLIKVGKQIKDIRKIVVLYGPGDSTEIPIRR
jgi:hypothetical protein